MKKGEREIKVNSGRLRKTDENPVLVCLRRDVCGYIYIPEADRWIKYTPSEVQNMEVSYGIAGFSYCPNCRSYFVA